MYVGRRARQLIAAIPPKTRREAWSIGITIGLGLLMLGLAIVSTSNHWQIGIGAAVGALGGFAHELAQSRGKILFFREADDGFYIGTIAGMVLGAVAGLLVVRGENSTATANTLIYDAFFAGLALKGVAEAATSAPAATTPASSTDTSALAAILPNAPRKPFTV